MNPIRAIQGVSLANGSTVEELGWGVPTNEETIAAGSATGTLVKNPTAGTLASFLALSGLSGAGYILIRKATVADDISPAQPNWVLPVLAATTLP